MMHRLCALFGLSALLACAMSWAWAEETKYAVDYLDAQMLISTSIRDANLVDVLGALFNLTNGKYDVRIANDVSGRIPQLTFYQQPFDKALEAILGTEYTYTKTAQGSGYRYWVRKASASSVLPDEPVARDPIDLETFTAGGSASFGRISNAGGGSLMPSVFQGAYFDSPSADESGVIRLIPINNVDLAGLCAALGGTMFNYSASGSGGGTGRTGTSSTSPGSGGGLSSRPTGSTSGPGTR